MNTLADSRLGASLRALWYPYPNEHAYAPNACSDCDDSPHSAAQAWHSASNLRQHAQLPKPRVELYECCCLENV